MLLNKHRATGMILCSEDTCVRKESHSPRLAVCRFIVVCCFVFRVYGCLHCEWIADYIESRLLFV